MDFFYRAYGWFERSLQSRQAMVLMLAALGLIGAAFVLVLTPDGAVLSPDSSEYIRLARSLLAGNGFSRAGRPETGWPPLYPATLAAIGLVSGSVETEPLRQSIRLFNAATFGLVVFLSGLLFARYLRSRTLVLCGIVTILFSFPLLQAHVYAWSETAFILFSVLFCWLLARFLDGPTWPVLFSLAFVALLACLQRYTGLSFVLAGGAAIVLFTLATPWRKRLAYAVVFGLVAVTPLILWLARNQALTESPTLYTQGTGSVFTRNQNASATLAVFQPNLIRLLSQVSEWFFPRALGIRALVFGVLMLLVVALAFTAIYRRYGNLRLSTLKRAIPVSPALFGLSYAASIMASTSLYLLALRLRYTALLYIPLMVLVFALLEGVYGLILRRVRHRILQGVILVGPLALWLAYLAVSTVNRFW